MFRYIKLKNYKSLVDLNVNLTGKRGKPKKLVLIYGENGVGKSNFVSAFDTLFETLNTKSLNEIFDKININNSDDSSLEDNFDKILSELKPFLLNGVENIIKKCKTINSSDNMILEFGLKINGKDAMYYLEFDNTKIVSEKLDYVLNKNQTTFFDIKDNGLFLNKGIFKNSDYENEIKKLISQYWGKHSLLSLLIFEKNEKNEKYIKNNISTALIKILNYFMNSLNISLKYGRRQEKGILNQPKQKIWGELQNNYNGKINIDDEEKLNQIELFLNDFFTQLYSDVKQVYFKKEYIDKTIKYKLMFKKLIYDKLLDIEFKNESTGTQNIFEMLPFLLSSIEGKTVVLDEMDTGIHDLLINTILSNLYDNIKGQVIITTHNTMLLESTIPKECFYVFNIDERANKQLIALNDFNDRLHPNLNIRKRYLKGMYGGIPIPMDLDFCELFENLE